MSYIFIKFLSDDFNSSIISLSLLNRNISLSICEKVERLISDFISSFSKFVILKTFVKQNFELFNNLENSSFNLKFE